MTVYLRFISSHNPCQEGFAFCFIPPQKFLQASIRFVSILEQYLWHSSADYLWNWKMLCITGYTELQFIFILRILSNTTWWGVTTPFTWPGRGESPAETTVIWALPVHNTNSRMLLFDKCSALVALQFLNCHIFNCCHDMALAMPSRFRFSHDLQKQKNVIICSVSCVKMGPWTNTKVVIVFLTA